MMSVFAGDIHIYGLRGKQREGETYVLKREHKFFQSGEKAKYMHKPSRGVRASSPG